ncbi:PTS sugar transporter subunit IIA [Roseomonas xinghualingensis]|uniref:PTS sugar transporter subunit IIA n=1 Tax=Roseomonas xinghualingensis TaxID=2986475 RepID=UPI0021F1F4C1|nr:PTS sugar transporter subunit IIA [Roseomonas sp. SXEYE001]MCV4208844.1 PTS sugar transporter subunit IIA [Roseomonas sp. SXEYE001]
MIGFVLVTHGRLAEELRLAMEHVMGPQKYVSTICIGPEDDLEGRRGDIRAAVDEVDQGDGVVVLTDMFGGTPSNLAASIRDRCKEPDCCGRQIEVIAGVSLPLLVKLAKLRGSEPLAMAVDHAVNAGRKYMATAGELRGEATVNGGAKR